MRDVLSDMKDWIERGRTVAVARVVEVTGGGPRELGSTMAINDLGLISGSVSGGCVESAVTLEALKSLGVSEIRSENGLEIEVENATADKNPRVHVFGYSDEVAFSVGLTCGGTLKVLIEPDAYETYSVVLNLLENDLPFVRVTVIGSQAQNQFDDPKDAPCCQYDVGGQDLRGPLAPVGSTLIISQGRELFSQVNEQPLRSILVRDATAALDFGTSMVRHYGRNGQAKLDELEVLYEVFSPRKKMVIFGAVDFSVALAQFSKTLGYNVLICDTRPLFATRARFPMADEVIVGWPERAMQAVNHDLGPRDAVCVLTHDPKFDLPAIEAALGTNVGYIGAMGSRRTCDDRLKRLIDSGHDVDSLNRVMAPIGLDIGAHSPQETAISILAEIISYRHGKNATSLRNRQGPIH